MSYKLADGSLSTDYEVGDEFVVIGNAALASPGDIVVFNEDDGTRVPYFGDQRIRMAIYWYELAPTPETKRKAQARKSAFTINSGDYIDSREFTREECERFCELAVECGFERGSAIDRKITRGWWAVGVSAIGGCVFVYDEPAPHFTTNTTAQFRKFLGKEKGMKQFTKDDLKDGMRVELRMGDTHYICGHMALHTKETASGRLIYLDKFNYNLTAVSNNPMFDIIRVTDRDGTVVFERQPEKRKVTFELTEEQERELRKQLFDKGAKAPKDLQ